METTAQIVAVYGYLLALVTLGLLSGLAPGSPRPARAVARRQAPRR